MSISNHHDAGRVPSSEPREQVLFQFNGQMVSGYEGEPVAAALIAAGIRVLRYMPNSNEPRGGFCFIGRCADCLMTIDGRPRVRACLTPLVPDMIVETESNA